MPIADNTADVVISNCVINLVPDKEQVFREAFRVLKPGGRLAVSDIVNTAPLPAELRIRSGAAVRLRRRRRAGRKASRPGSRAAGFVGVRVTPKPESRELIKTWAAGRGVENHIVSAIVEARKPSAQASADD